MPSSHLAFFPAILALCMLFACGCQEKPRGPAAPYVKPSAVDGGPNDPVIRAIEAMGGTCFRHHQLRGLLVDRDSYWMEETDGNSVICVEIDDCLESAKLLNMVVKLKQIQSLCIRRSSLTDEDAVQIARMESLRSLRLENTSFTKNGLLELSKLKLRHLNFDFNQIGDQGMDVLANIDTLEELHLNGSVVTDNGCARIADLENLKYLHVGSPNLSDAGIATLVNLESLEEVSITNSNITGIGFQNFSGSKIRILKLNHCKVTPVGLRGISQLPAVEELSLFSSSVTDAGLSSLARMPRLQSLDLYGNTVTETGLRKLLPSSSLRTVDVAQCKITTRECKRFNEMSGQIRAIIYDD